MGHRCTLQGESQFLTIVWHQPFLTRMDVRQALGRVLEAPELCQKLTLWLLGSGEVEKEEQVVINVHQAE